jgi:hypothetical protein
VIPTAAVVAGGVALMLLIIGLVVYLTLNSPGVF